MEDRLLPSATGLLPPPGGGPISSFVRSGTPPQVTAVSIAEGAVLAGPPTELTVTFSEPVNLPQLAAAAYQPKGPGVLGAVYVQGPGGLAYYPHFESYDAATHQARFLMLDRLTPGAWTLHLSGPQGLTNLTGQALAGNDPSGDHVVHFTVHAMSMMEMDGMPGLADYEVMDLGALFPHELAAGVTIPGSPSPGQSDCYCVEVLQYQLYVITLTGTGDLSKASVLLMDGEGHLLASTNAAQGNTIAAYLPAGMYLVGVGGAQGSYQLHVRMEGDPNNPPLVVLPGPALRIRPVTAPGTGSVPSFAPPPLVLVIPSQPGGTQGGGLPTVAGVPMGVATSLGVGPVGGVPGSDPLAPPSTDYLFVCTDDASMMESVLGGVVLTQVGQPDVSLLIDGMDGTVELPAVPLPSPRETGPEPVAPVEYAPVIDEATVRTLALHLGAEALPDAGPTPVACRQAGVLTARPVWIRAVALAAASATAWWTRPRRRLAARTVSATPPRPRRETA
jgi:hypothetical protein